MNVNTEKENSQTTPPFCQYALGEKKAEQMLDNIDQQGYAVLDNAIPQALIAQLLADSMTRQAEFSSAGIGRQQDLHRNDAIRKDQTLWLDQSNASNNISGNTSSSTSNNTSNAQQNFLALMTEIQLMINRHFYMGLFDYECHYARYGRGDFYKKHLDAFKGRSNRVLSTVCYLNTPQEGGELLLYAEDGTQILTKVAATAGTLVVFESERFPHEVLPAKAERYSIAGWFRTNNSVGGVVDPAL